MAWAFRGAASRHTSVGSAWQIVKEKERRVWVVLRNPDLADLDCCAARGPCEGMALSLRA